MIFNFSDLSMSYKLRDVKKKGRILFGLCVTLAVSGCNATVPCTVPQVLRCCSEFVETHGIVDGIYRLSGVSSNIQKLR